MCNLVYLLYLYNLYHTNMANKKLLNLSRLKLALRHIGVIRILIRKSQFRLKRNMIT